VRRFDALRDFETLVRWLEAASVLDAERAGGIRRRAQQQPAGAAAALKDLEKEQKARATRTKRDSIDRALVDLAGFYRDVLAVQAEAPVELVNDEMRDAIIGVARASTPESTLRRIDAILAARTAIGANVAPLLAVEAMAVGLRRG
jgi:DNA polymerase-3 subunit delta'